MASTNLEASTAAMLTDVTNTFDTSSPDYLQPFKMFSKKVAFPQITVHPSQGIKGSAIPDLIEIADLCEAVRSAHCGT